MQNISYLLFETFAYNSLDCSYLISSEISLIILIIIIIIISISGPLDDLLLLELLKMFSNYVSLPSLSSNGQGNADRDDWDVTWRHNILLGLRKHASRYRKQITNT